MEDVCGDVVVVMALGLGVGFRNDFVPDVVIVVAVVLFHVALVIVHDGGKQRHGGLTSEGVERHTDTERIEGKKGE